MRAFAHTYVREFLCTHVRTNIGTSTSRCNAPCRVASHHVLPHRLTDCGVHGMPRHGAARHGAARHGSHQVTTSASSG
eukprot:11197515-Lingulodinium_polyedra.AAC.1